MKHDIIQGTDLKRMDLFEGFGKPTPLNPRLRNRWVYKRSSWQRKVTYNCGLYYRRWTGTWSSLDIFYTNNIKEGEKNMIFRQLKVLLLTKRPGKCKRFKNKMTIKKKIYRLQPQLRINGKKKVAISFFFNKSKKDDEMEVVDEKYEDKAGILGDVNYHDNIDAENY